MHTALNSQGVTEEEGPDANGFSQGAARHARQTTERIERGVSFRFTVHSVD
jgi:hypothetical protein